MNQYKIPIYSRIYLKGQKDKEKEIINYFNGIDIISMSKECSRLIKLIKRRFNGYENKKQL